MSLQIRWTRTFSPSLFFRLQGLILSNYNRKNWKYPRETRTCGHSDYKLWDASGLHLQSCSVQFSHSVMSDSLRPHELQHARPPCPSPTCTVHPDPCPLSRWCHPTISSSVVPFSSCPQSFPASVSGLSYLCLFQGRRGTDLHLHNTSWIWRLSPHCCLWDQTKQWISIV